MSKYTRRKKDTKCKAANDAVLTTNKSLMPDISKYMLKQPDLDEVDICGNNVSVPCPDDAALPSSTSCETLKDLTHKKTDNHGSHEISSVESPEKNEKGTVPVKKVNSSNSASKKKSRNSHITDFFSVRRSNRIPLISKMSERNKIIEDAILSGIEEGFQIKVYPDKGRGVITTKAFKKGEFVLEYYGELIDYEEAKRRESIYSDKENIGCYMYYFKFKNKQYCIDATKETDRLGRLVNHSKKGNLRTQTFLIKESPRLVLFANRDIEAGEELSYDYGDRRKSVVESHPWLAT